MTPFRPFAGGVAIPHLKATADKTVVPLALPDIIVLPLLQHIGKACDPCVNKGDQVLLGQVVGDSTAPFSVPVHSPVSGTVTDISSRLWAGGNQVTTITIQPDGLQTRHPGIQKPAWNSTEEFLALVRSSGLVGLGGAGFPTHIKLKPDPAHPVDTLIINGAECEPYITSDYRVMMERTSYLVQGIRILKEQFGYTKVIMGIENNKLHALHVFKSLLSEIPGAEVKSLVSQYPQGAEKTLIHSLVGRQVPTGGLPSHVGVVVMNVTTIANLAMFLETGMPLVSKVVTVDGDIVNHPGNYEVPIGTPLHKVFESIGGLKGEPGKVIMGGPMMGIAQYNLETSVVKQTNALLAFSREASMPRDPMACIRCGRCVQACPMSLLPLEIIRAVLRSDDEDARRHHVESCIECGSCTYSCPAGIQLVQLLRLGKLRLRNQSVKGGA